MGSASLQEPPGSAMRALGSSGVRSSILPGVDPTRACILMDAPRPLASRSRGNRLKRRLKRRVAQFVLGGWVSGRHSRRKTGPRRARLGCVCSPEVRTPRPLWPLAPVADQSNNNKKTHSSGPPPPLVRLGVGLQRYTGGRRRLERRQFQRGGQLWRRTCSGRPAAR